MRADKQLHDHLSTLRGSSVVILGVGNTLKGDDGAGPLLCRQIMDRVSATVMDAGTVPENYVRPIINSRSRHLLIVDAADFGAAPGALRLFRPQDVASSAFSTHALSPRLFIDLLRAEMDIDIHLIGIQPAQTGFGEPVSPEVQQSLDALSDLMVRLFPRRSSS